MEDEFPTTEGASFGRTKRKMTSLFRDPPVTKRSTAAQRYLRSEGNRYLEFEKGSSDFDLRMISNKLGSEWRKLATNLGLSTAEIENIVMDDPGHTDKQIFIMLVKWKSKVSTSLDQREVLWKALMEIGRRDIAEDLLEMEDKLTTPEVASMSNTKSKLVSSAVDEPSKLVEEQLRNTFFPKLSSELGLHWRLLALNLGFSPSELQTLETAYMSFLGIQNFKMLETWWKKQENPADAPGKLRDALKAIHRADLALQVPDTLCKKQDDPADIHAKLGHDVKYGGFPDLASEDPGISDFDLQMISYHLRSEWQVLAKNLGFSIAEIMHIAMDKPDHSANKIFIMLVKWKSRVSTSTDQREVLCKALMKIGRRDIAEDLLEMEDKLTTPEVASMSNTKSKLVSSAVEEPSQLGITDTILHKISDRLRSDWRCLALQLGLSAAEIQRIKSNQTFNMLVKWRHQQSTSTDQREVLYTALIEIGRPDIAEDLLVLFCETEMVDESTMSDVASMGNTKSKLVSTAVEEPSKLVRRSSNSFGASEASKRRLMNLKLSSELGRDWELLATTLGFSLSEMHGYQTVYEGNLERQSFMMLHDWWSAQANPADAPGKLRDALEAIGRVDLASQVPDTLCKKQDNPADIHAKLRHDVKYRGRPDLSSEVPASRVLDLHLICNMLGSDFWKLATHLGFSAADINRIELEFAGQPENQIWKMICMWRCQRPTSMDQRDELCTALVEIGRRDIVEHMTIAREEEHKVESMSTETTSLKMAARPTHKINEDTEDQRLQEPSHLQQVLDEVNKLTETLTASERLDSTLQLPYIAMGYFNEMGGSLSLDEYGAHLTIPRGAIAPGSPQQVYIYVDPSASPNGADEPTVSFSQNFECGPEGLRFKESVVLSFPHHADVKSKRSDTLRPRMCQHNNSSERWEEFDGSAVITEDRVILLVDHFTGFGLSGQSSKRLLIVPYGDVFDPRQGKYQIRVYVLNDDKKVKENVEKDEKHSKRLDSFQNLSWGEDDLAVKLSEFPRGCKVFEGETQTFKEKQIKEHASNCVTFTLGLPNWPTDDILYCAVEIYQYCEDEDKGEQGKVRLSICPDMKKPERGAAVQRCICDSSTACSQTHTTSDGTSMTLQDAVMSGFSKRQPNQSAMGDSCDLARIRYSETYKQVKLDASNDNSRQCITVNSNTLVYNFKTDGENTSTVCQKISQEICRAETEELKMSRRTVIDDSTLRTLSKKLGAEWESLATFLGIGKHDIYKIKSDNPHNAVNQMFNMLVKWRDEQYLQDQVDQLGYELTKMQRGDIVKTLRDIEDSSLRMVSNKLGPHWEPLATSLCVDTDKFQNNLCDTRENTFQMLVEWRDKQLSRKMQIDKLCKELEMAEREDLAHQVRELISERDPEKLWLPKKPQIMEQTSGNHAGAMWSKPPSMITNYSHEELISDSDPEKPELLEKPEIMDPRQPGDNHASAVGGGDQSCMKTNTSSTQLIGERDPENPRLLEKPEIMEQARDNHNSVTELISNIDPDKPELLEEPEIMAQRQPGDNHASATGGDQPCMKTNPSSKQLISDRGPGKFVLLEEPEIMEQRQPGDNHASATGGDQPCMKTNTSSKRNFDQICKENSLLHNTNVISSSTGVKKRKNMSPTA